MRGVRRFRNAAATLGGLCCLYTIGWFVAADRLQNEAAASIENARQRDVFIEAEWRDVSGFPFALVLSSPRWSLSTMSGVAWSGEGLAIRIRPWRPQTAEIALLGAHRVSAPLRERRTVEAAIVGGAFTTTRKADAVSFTAARIEVSDNGAAPIAIENFAAMLAVEPALPTVPNLAALKDWSAGGGRIVVEQAGGRFASTDFAFNGWVGIDSVLRPTGRTELALTSYAPLLRAIAARGWIDGRNLPMIEVALAWLSVPDAKTGAPVLKLPLIAENGVLSFGPVTLAELQPLL